MTTDCKPSVNRFRKMVPEGGFEPPTRGFSILLQPLKNKRKIVNRLNFRLNSFKYIANALQTVSPSPYRFGRA